MHKTIIYIAGRIAGDGGYKAKFAAAEALFDDTEFAVLNPAMLPEGMDKSRYMPICFAMLEAADIVYFLPDWKDSAGAKIEYLYAQYQHKPIVMLQPGEVTAEARCRKCARDCRPGCPCAERQGCETDEREIKKAILERR